MSRGYGVAATPRVRELQAELRDVNVAIAGANDRIKEIEAEREACQRRARRIIEGIRAIEREEADQGFRDAWCSNGKEF